MNGDDAIRFNDKVEALKAAQARIAELEKERDALKAQNEMLFTANNDLSTIFEERDALQSQVRTLRGALEPLAHIPLGPEMFIGDDYRSVVLYKNSGNFITVDNVLNARAALNSTASIDLGHDWKSRAEAAERERDSLRKALDDRWEADCKAAKAIMAAEGRTTGFPSVKDVVGFYMAQAEKLAEALEKIKMKLESTITAPRRWPSPTSTARREESHE